MLIAQWTACTCAGDQRRGNVVADRASCSRYLDRYGALNRYSYRTKVRRCRLKAHFAGRRVCQPTSKAAFYVCMYDVVVCRKGSYDLYKDILSILLPLLEENDFLPLHVSVFVHFCCTYLLPPCLLPFTFLPFCTPDVKYTGGGGVGFVCNAFASFCCCSQSCCSAVGRPSAGRTNARTGSTSTGGTGRRAYMKYTTYRRYDVYTAFCCCCYSSNVCRDGVRPACSKEELGCERLITAMFFEPARTMKPDGARSV